MVGPLTIGITGGIGSGKSTICTVFQSLGIRVYDADTRAKWLMNHHEELQKAIINAFGPSSYENGDLNRAYLAQLVFSDPEKVILLNQLVHPAVGRDFEDWVLHNADAPYLLKEAALLVESGAYKQLDHLILVTAPESIRVQRVLDRDKQRTPEEVLHMMRRQLSDEEKQPFCRFLLVNDGKSPVLPAILALHDQLTDEGLAKKAKSTP